MIDVVPDDPDVVPAAQTSNGQRCWHAGIGALHGLTQRYNDVANEYLGYCIHIHDDGTGILAQEKAVFECDTSIFDRGEIGV